ncbi:Alpha-1,2-mannosyltransferase ALG9 [Galdieria sulphuraria]|nr:Alpha-1,2-mannosyltransferase ALG9 [Galdieria sulphuraria]
MQVQPDHSLHGGQFSPLLHSYHILSRWNPRPWLIFLLYTIDRVIAAFCLSISDCDETFNYWEPLHFILYGFGFQTWEYSPEFRLRSYAYLLIYALFGKLFALFVSKENKVAQFFFIRILIGIFDAVSETFLYRSLSKKFGSSTSLLFFLFSLLSPGLFISTTSILPSSFSLILFNFALSYWISEKWVKAVVFVSIAALWGWPFVAVLGIPLALYIAYLKGIGYMCKITFLLAIFNLLPLFLVDSYFYGKPSVTPLQLILYNVFPKKGKGSEIFGVEPWYYYILNLFLNFNIVFLLSLVFMPVFLLIFPLSKFKISFLWNNRQQWMESLWYCSPLYLWSMIYLSQPHKEERFFFPVYSLICLSGAICLHSLQRVLQLLEQWFNSKKILPNSSMKKSKLLIGERLIVCFLFLFICLSLGRIIILVRGYQAPLNVYKEFSRRELQKDFHSSREYNLCIGKEWYRFMSHFFIPKRQIRVRWIPCGFDGILPQYFDESGIPKGTRTIPLSMNDENRAVPEQFFYSLNACDYLIDWESFFDEPNELSKGLRPILSEPFLDNRLTSRSFRVFYIPFISSRAVYGRYVLYILNGFQNSTT